MPSYPTACEAISAITVLQYLGYDIAPEEFIPQHLSKSADFYLSHGKLYGPDPYQTFVGDPRDETSFGCMAPVIANALNSLPEKLKSFLLTGSLSLNFCLM